MKRSVFLALVVLLGGATPSAANIGRCLKVEQLYFRGIASLAGIEAACGAIAQAGDRTALRILGSAYYRSGRLEQAEGQLSRAAHLGDSTSSFVLAGLYHRTGDMERARLWARRGQQRLSTLSSAGSTSSHFVERVKERVQRLVGSLITDLLAEEDDEGEALEGVAENPFLGRWRVGPNATCDSSYITLDTDAAASHFFGRRQAYDEVRYDLDHNELTLVSGIGRMTLRLVDPDTMEVVGVVDELSSRVTRSGVVATRCT